MRDHRLRERRLKLGVSQDLVGQLAGLPIASAQGIVSHTERHPHKVSAWRIRKIRSALVYLETEPRRRRAEVRYEECRLRHTESALLDPTAESSVAFLLDRLIELLWDGRGADFDCLAEKVHDAIVLMAGDIYLEQSTPVFFPKND